jgi:hypothetical protein
LRKGFGFIAFGEKNMYRPESLIIDNNKLRVFEELNKILLEQNTFDITTAYFNLIFTENRHCLQKCTGSQKPNLLQDCKALDDIIFDILSLTEDERNEMCWSVGEIVKNRL